MGAGERHHGHAVVIGAGPGIGASVARRFAREGLRITLVARDLERLERLAAELRSAGGEADVAFGDAADPETLRATLESIAATSDPVDVLVYNAALLRPSRALTVSAEDLLAAYTVDVVGAAIAAQVLVPGMRAAGRGTVLFTSGSAAIRPSPGIATVSLGKAALRSLATMLAAELADEGVQVTSVTVSGAVAPGTPFDPERIADLYWHVHTRPRSDWSAEVPFDGVEQPSAQRDGRA